MFNLNSVKYSELHKIRCDRLEKNVPWGLVSKTGMRSFCKTIGVETVNTIKTLNSLEDLRKIELPDKFVLKPVDGHSSLGVMILERKGIKDYHDLFSDTELSIDEIIATQNNIVNKLKIKNATFIIEEYIPDVFGDIIPHDFKFFIFQGEIAMIMEINRNLNDKQKWYFYNSDFSPVRSGKVVPMIKDFRIIRRPTPSFDKELMNLAERLSHAVPTPFARIDLYFDGNVAKVGEITLTPFYGFPYKWSSSMDHKMGQMWIDAIYRMGRDVDYFYSS